MKKLLITGAGGFLGKHVKNQLHNLSNFEFLTPNSKELDLTDSLKTKEYFCYNKPNAVLHMAAVCGGIGANSKRPAEFIASNSKMSLNIFDGALSSGVEKVYTLGSVCAYPKYCPAPFKEDDIWNGYPEETNAPYGLSKKMLMVLGNSYRQQFGIGGAHLIPVNMYGEHDNFNLETSHVIPALIKKFSDAVASKKDKVFCWGTGEATREFLYAGDCAIAIVKAIQSGLDTDQPINIGMGKEISIKALAQLIAQLTGFDGQIIFNNEVSDGQPRRLLDTSRAKEILGFEAKTNLLTGLTKTICWFQNTYN